MGNAQLSQADTSTNKLLRGYQILIGGFQLTVDCSAEGVVIPIAPRDGQIVLEYSAATPNLKFSDAGISAVLDFFGTECGTFVPWDSIRDAECTLAPKDVAESVLRLIERQ